MRNLLIFSGQDVPLETKMLPVKSTWYTCVESPRGVSVLRGQEGLLPRLPQALTGLPPPPPRNLATLLISTSILLFTCFFPAALSAQGGQLRLLAKIKGW